MASAPILIWSPDFAPAHGHGTRSSPDSGLMVTT